MNTLTLIQSQLGMMFWPFTIMSLLMVTIIAERVLFMLLNARSHSKKLINEIKQMTQNQQLEEDYIETLRQRRGTLAKGGAMLLSHRHHEKQLREETMAIWLQKYRIIYTSGLRFLSIIGMIAPLVGLLGTVLGLITMFQDLSTTSGAIEPSQLANGLGLAMSTTAMGLLIALPAITCSHLFQMWSNTALAKIEHTLNYINLYLEGVRLEKPIEAMEEN